MTLKLLCRIEHIVNHGERVYTVSLRPNRLAPRFRAGQFLHLTLDPYDPSRFWPESRAFSIASAPSERDLLRICYSVRGRFTARMEDELVEGRQVWIKMPYGEFVVDCGHDVVLFAGGTGVSAFTAFLEGLKPDTPHSIVLAYGARNARLLIYRDVLEERTKSVRSFEAFYFVEDGTVSDPMVPDLDPRTTVGRVSVATLWPKLARPLQASYYVSGPPAMLQTISADLRARGISPEAIHIDAWE